MRHNKKFNHLGRKASHRNAMLANMAVSLIEHKRINTTLARRTLYYQGKGGYDSFKTCCIFIFA